MDTSESKAREPDVVRQIQQLIDQNHDASGAADAVIDVDTETCIGFLIDTPPVEFFLITAVSDDAQAADVPHDSFNRTGRQADRPASSVELHEKQVWHFQYERLLGAGGFAVVMAVRAVETGQLYAMKVLRPSLRWSRSHQKRFLREAELIASLTHPGIVPVIGTGLIRANPFILSELVDGPNLAQRLSGHGSMLEPDLAVSLIRQIAQALQAAHESGILHRDLKPENILLQHDQHGQWVPRITDFGLARRCEPFSFQQSASITKNVLIGTVRYMAPEVVLGKNQSGSVQADEFSLAAILFECLTGHVPFEGRGYLDIVGRIQSAPVTMASRLNPGISSELSNILGKALCRDPEYRYRTVAEFDKDLQRFQLLQPVLARQSRFLVAFREFTTSFPRLITAAWVAALIASVSLLIISALYYRERAATAQLRSMLQTTMNSVRDYIDVSENLLNEVPATVPQRYELLKKALQAQELVARGLEYNSESRYRLSVLQSLLADVSYRLGKAEISRQHSRECLQLLEQLCREEPHNSDYRYDVFYNRKCLADRMSNASREERILAKQDVLQEITELTRLDPLNPDFADALASSHFILGQEYSFGGDDRCRRHFLESIRISEQLWKEHPEKLLYVKYSLLGRAELADFCRRNQDLTGSEQLTSEAMELQKRIHHPETGAIWFQEVLHDPFRSYASTLRSLKRWEEAETAFEQCLAVEERLYEHNPVHAPFALWRAIHAAERLRAARHRGIDSAQEQELLDSANQRLEDMRKTGQWGDRIPRIEAVLRNPDAPPVEADK